ncbi:MAG: OmpA family protein [Bacteroidota bacterium]
MKYFLLLSIACCLSYSLLAQPLAGSSNIEQLMLAAETAEEQDNWYYALEKYKEAYDKQKDDKELLLKLANLNYNLRDFISAERYYKQLFRRIEPEDATNNDHRFYYGRSLKINEKPDEAVMVFQDYLRHVEIDSMRTLAEREIVGAEMAMNAPEETSEVTVEGVGRKVNGMFSEYSPALAEDGKVLYFSTWAATEVVVPEDVNAPENFSRIFMSTQKENRKGEVEWQKAEPLSVEVNRPGTHTANPAISVDGRRLFYNRIVLEGNKPSEAVIYSSDVDDTGWKSGNEVEGVNGDYLALQPAVGELFGKEVLFFASDMPGGYGGLDIYYAPYEGDNSYGDPVNLGKTINTIGDDYTPFYYDGTLYYTTDGLPTMGGTDIYYSVWNGTNWSEPENMGPGFNTAQDDQSFRLYGDGYVGFLTSNRLGGRSVKSKTCCDDIYGFEIAQLYADLVVGIFTEDKKGLVGGNTRLVPVANGTPLNDGEKQQKEKGNRFDYGLDLETEYIVIADHPDYYPDTFAFNTLGLEESKTIEHRFFLKAKPVPPPKPEFDTITIEEAIVLENILYDFNKSAIRPEAEADLSVVQGLMEEYPDMVIELSSHTDARGNASYNKTLSKRRADSARRWLIGKGISGSRIKTEGYGKTVPQTVNDRIKERYDWLTIGDVLTEEYIAGLGSTEQQEAAHELNRRTEFKILEGPTSIIIKREILEKKPTPAPNRNSLPQAKPIKEANDTLVRSPLSSLYGQKELDGLPVLRFDHRKLNLGLVKKGETRSFSYTFTNIGSAPAQIMLIQACDCTTTEHDNSKIYQPGESGTIEVTFDSKDKTAAETITVDIFLEQNDAREVPIIEAVEYDFDIAY